VGAQRDDDLYHRNQGDIRMSTVDVVQGIWLSWCVIFIQASLLNMDQTSHDWPLWVQSERCNTANKNIQTNLTNDTSSPLLQCAGDAVDHESSSRLQALGLG
jgi:hypothetical protein